jgi:benzil reductase ((S)-benzoin forming)
MSSDTPPSRKVFIVTGTSRGIGKAFADEILKRGHRLYSLNRQTDPDSGRHRTIACDLSDADQVDRAMAMVVGSIDPVDCRELVLINNAGVLGPIGPFDRITDRQMKTNLHTNLAAPLQLISRFISLTPNVIAIRRIINITSGAGEHAYAGWSLYCSAKAALNMVTQCVHLEQKRRPFPVGICAVAPGVVDTDMQGEVRASDPDDFPQHSRFVDLQSSGLLSDPAQVASLILDLDQAGQLSSGGIYDLRAVRWENGHPQI